MDHLSSYYGSPVVDLYLHDICTPLTSRSHMTVWLNEVFLLKRRRKVSVTRCLIRIFEFYCTFYLSPKRRKWPDHEHERSTTTKRLGILNLPGIRRVCGTDIRPNY